MNDENKQILRSLKTKIKSWELTFLKDNGRKAEKDDIAESPEDIKDSYKKYWAIKKQEEKNLELSNYKADDVWSEKLNKSSLKCAKVPASVKNLDKFCDKLKEQAKTIVFKKNPSQVHSKGSSIKDKNPVQLSNNLRKQCEVSQGPDIDLNEDAINIEYESKKANFEVQAPQASFKKLKNISVLFPTVNLNGTKKLSQFQTNIDNDWLERCESRNFLEQTEIEQSTIFEESFVKDTSINVSVPIIATDAVEPNSMAMHDKTYDVNSSFSKTTNCADGIGCTSNNLADFKPNVKCTEINSDVRVPNENLKAATSLTVVNVLNEVSKKRKHFAGELGDSISSDRSDDFENREALSKEDNKKIKLNECDTIAPKSLKRSNQLTHLERKKAAGTINENFVRVNIKKKKFSRGFRQTNVKKMKWNKWKQLKKGNLNSDGGGSSKTGCFKCGQLGHWARNCLSSKSENTLMPEIEDFEDAPLPTLEEAAQMAKGTKVDAQKINTVKVFSSAEEIEFSQQIAGMTGMGIDDPLKSNNENNVTMPKKLITPLFNSLKNEQLIDTPDEVYEALQEMGHTNFRNGQERAVMRILSGLSTLVVLPTGSGKSLCYQLPALLYAKHQRCMTVVISPLLSLMDDQVTGLPSCIKAVCLHSGMTATEKEMALKDLSDGIAQILLVSPEAVIGGQRYGTGFLQENMPPIGFACIDEVHCLSQWSHNFRPSYLQLCKVLKQKLGVKCILGLTATATRSTIADVVRSLQLKSVEESVVGQTNVPHNLHLSISRDKDKDRALIQLLSGDRFQACHSIIIYCIRRDETERLATLIRTCMQDKERGLTPATTSGEKKKTKKASKNALKLWTAEAYHAGLTSSKRKSIQKRFMSGKLHIVIATIAFGMGLDKADVRAIIHYNMPKSFESYVQEIGRAGRDGLDSHCHLFLDSEGKDLCELQRHIYANSTDRYVIRKLLQKVFVPCKCAPKPQVFEEDNEMEETDQNKDRTECVKHEIAFAINETVQELDMKEENILTLLCYLELHSKHWIELLSPVYATCTIRCYGGSKQMHALALKCPSISASMALDAKNNKKWEKSAQYCFPVVTVSSYMGWQSSSVKSELKRLEWNDQKRKTGAIVEFSDLAFHVLAPGNLSDKELDFVLDFLSDNVKSLETKELENLKALAALFHKFSASHYWACSDGVDLEFSDAIKHEINNYFQENSEPKMPCKENLENEIMDYSEIRERIRSIICTNHDQNFNGRAIARIFHGISSPCYPAEVWGRVWKFWRCLLHVDFNTILKLANEEIRNLK